MMATSAPTTSTPTPPTVVTGSDRISFISREAPVTVNLTVRPVHGIAGENDTLQAREEVTGSPDDTVTGNAADNEFDLSDGDDTAVGGCGRGQHLRQRRPRQPGWARTTRTSSAATARTTRSQAVTGDDGVEGGDGDDTVSGGAGRDSVNGGVSEQTRSTVATVGEDTASYSDKGDPVVADLAGDRDDGNRRERPDLQHGEPGRR